MNNGHLVINICFCDVNIIIFLYKKVEGVTIAFQKYMIWCYLYTLYALGGYSHGGPQGFLQGKIYKNGMDNFFFFL